MEGLDVDDVNALKQVGEKIRGWMIATPFPPELERAVREAYAAMMKREGPGIAVAVRSSATAEDLPDASFAELEPGLRDALTVGRPISGRR